MKKTTLFLAALMAAFVVAARPYTPMADSTYVVPVDTTTVTPPSDDDVLPDTPPYDEPDTLAMKNFTPNIEVLNLRVGEIFQLELTWDYPEGEAIYSPYISYSYDERVISIDEEGLITARGVGETVVSIRCMGVEKSCTVVVSDGGSTAVQHRGQMTLPLGEFCDDRGNDFNVTLADGTLRLQGTFWGHACIPSELEYEILDGTAYFTLHTNYEDSTCTDGYQGTFAVSQTIDVEFTGCVSEAYNVYINNTLSSIYAAPEQKAYYVRTTSIDTPEATPEDSPYYDLQGRKVTNPVRGIYIKDGRKLRLSDKATDNAHAASAGLSA